MAFKFAYAACMLSSLSSADKSWYDDFTLCNMYRIVEQECPDEQPVNNGRRYIMIPATQRTDNPSGYALDVTPWSTKSQLWIKMEAWTPQLVANSIFEMYTTIQDTWDTSRTMYDTVKCQVEFWSGADGNSINSGAYSVEDYSSLTLFYSDTTDGNNETSVAAYVDSAIGGNTDWYLSPVQDENYYECNDSYCKF